MDITGENNAGAAKNETLVERASDRELVVTRTFAGPAHAVFSAWTKPELLQRWWVPKSCGISFVSCEADARTGGTYRFVFNHPAAPTPMTFFGRYLEVAPPKRLVWTNDQPGPITTVTFEERGAQTLLVMRDLYPSKKALDDAIASGSATGASEQFEQLDRLLAAQEPAAPRP